jgi:hypothetical protein
MLRQELAAAARSAAAAKTFAFLSTLAIHHYHLTAINKTTYHYR